MYMYITIIFKHSFFETARSINAKFHVGPSWDVGRKLNINGTGHMTKVAALPIYGKNL